MPIIITADSLRFPTVSKITPNKEIRYPVNDLGSVYIHYDKTTGKNVPTENKLRSESKNEESECEF